MPYAEQPRTWISVKCWPVPLIAVVFLSPIMLTQSVAAQTFTVIHNFTGGQDGANPYSGLTMDKAGSLYGTALYDGAGYGTVYQLKHKGSGWVFNPLYSFAGGDDGAGPQFDGGALVFGPDGTLYGTTNGGVGAAARAGALRTPDAGRFSICDRSRGPVPAHSARGWNLCFTASREAMMELTRKAVWSLTRQATSTAQQYMAA